MATKCVFYFRDIYWEWFRCRLYRGLWVCVSLSLASFQGYTGWGKHSLGISLASQPYFPLFPVGEGNKEKYGWLARLPGNEAITFLTSLPLLRDLTWNTLSDEGTPLWTYTVGSPPKLIPQSAPLLASNNRGGRSESEVKNHVHQSFHCLVLYAWR